MSDEERRWRQQWAPKARRAAAEARFEWQRLEERAVRDHRPLVGRAELDGASEALEAFARLLDVP